MDVFNNDESGYLAWHTEHPSAFLLNRFGGTNPSYNVLHRSSCVFLWRDRDDGSRTKVEKWCSDSESELSDQANLILGLGMWKKCGVCLRPTQECPPPMPLPMMPDVAVGLKTRNVWVAGEPAVWLGSGEKEWKQSAAAALSRNVPTEKPQWIDVEFRLPQHKLFAKDIDNLLTPVLESARDASWVERGFANLGSVTARKIGVANVGLAGAVVTPLTMPPTLAASRMGVVVEVPVTGLDADTVKWALYDTSFQLFKQRPELRFPPQSPMSMEIRVTVSNAGRRKSLQALMKPCIDGMEPLLGHPYNLFPEPRDSMKRRLAPQDEMVLTLAFHVRGGDSDAVSILLCPFKEMAQ